MQDQVNRERALSEWLRQVAEADAASGASPAVRERLLEEVRARRRMRRIAATKMYALAAGLVMATALPVWQLATRPAVEESPRVVTSASGDAEVATAFYPLAYGAVPVTRGNIVRVAVSPTAVAALGVEPLGGTASPTDVLLADVVVGEDGLARAVRFVRTLPRERRSAGPGDSRSAGPGDSRSAGPGDSRSAGPGDSRSAGPGDSVQEQQP